MAASRPELTVLVPVFNEADNLSVHLPVIREAVAACTREYEILIVDDGSTDRGPAFVEDLARRDRRIRLRRHPGNLGPGAAIPTALFWARGAWILFLPADLGCEPDDLPALWRARTGADVVVGLRSDRRDYPAWRKLLSVGYIGLLRALSGSRIRQFNYLQLYRRSVFANLPVRSRGVFVTAEIILRAERAGLRLVEVPLRYRPRLHGRAAGARPGAVARALWELTGYLAGG